MEKKRIAPQIRETATDWYKENFSTTNAGVVFILESFPELYKRVMLEIKEKKFIRGELLLIIDVYNATALTPGMPMLEAQVSDGIALDGLDKKWEINAEALIKKVESLTSFQSTVLEIWANGYWYAQQGKELRDLEEYAKELL
jgi:hypothetical protein